MKSYNILSALGVSGLESVLPKCCESSSDGRNGCIINRLLWRVTTGAHLQLWQANLFPSGGKIGNRWEAFRVVNSWWQLGHIRKRASDNSMAAWDNVWLVSDHFRNWWKLIKINDNRYSRLFQSLIFIDSQYQSINYYRLLSITIDFINYRISLIRLTRSTGIAKKTWNIYSKAFG